MAAALGRACLAPSWLCDAPWDLRRVLGCRGHPGASKVPSGLGAQVSISWARAQVRGPTVAGLVSIPHPPQGQGPQRSGAPCPAEAGQALAEPAGWLTGFPCPLLPPLWGRPRVPRSAGPGVDNWSPRDKAGPRLVGVNKVLSEPSRTHSLAQCPWVSPRCSSRADRDRDGRTAGPA